MIAFLALIVAVVALIRVTQVERELRELRARLGRIPPVPPLERQPPPPGRAVGVEAEPVEPAAPVVVSRLPQAATDVHVQTAGIPRPIGGGDTSGDDGPRAFERRIGERLLLYAGTIVLVLGVAFFLRYAFEHEWMSPRVRVLLGGVAGIALLAVGRRLAHAGYRQYGLFLSGGGVAMLFLCVYAAYAFYALIPQVPAFVLLAGIAAGAAVLADRESSLPLALMAVCGGFATPFLVGGRGDAQLVLFSYIAALIAATMYLSWRRSWPWLNLASFIFTVFIVAAWADEYYTAARYLRTELFLTLYCAMFLAILRANRRSGDLQARVVSAMLWLAPLMYHGASLVILNEHGLPFLVYLLLVSVAIIVGSIEADAPPARLAGWFLVTLPLIAWIGFRGPGEWESSAVVTAIGIWLVFLASSVRLAFRGERLDRWDVTLLHVSGIGVFVTVYAAIAETSTSHSAALVAAALAGANALVWLVLRARTSAALHWLGLAFSLLAIAAALGLDGQWRVVMWAAEAAVLVWVGVRADRDAFRIAGLALFAVACWLWTLIGAPGRSQPFTPLLNARGLAGAVIVALLYLAGWVMRGRRSDEAAWRLERAVALVGASLMTVVVVSFEIGSYWARQEAGGSARLALHLMLSAWWAAYAGVLVTIGMRRHYAPIRYFAILLFAATLLKVFAVDVQQLAGIYRVVAFLVVGGILLLVSFLYQRSRADDTAG